MITQKAIIYTGTFFLFVITLQQFGLKLSALLGAAGIIGIALGFASQTSVSNIISGLFLIGEKPFEVGDLVKVGDKQGRIYSIDLLSIKLRTYNNQFIRIPNENLIKTDLINVTRFPIRRVDLKVGVAYKENIKAVIAILKDVAEKNPLVLNEPEPFIMFEEFGDSSLNILFGVWVTKEDYWELKASILIEIKERFDKEGVEIPFPHRTLYTGSVTNPLPIRMVGNNPTSSKE
jgi:small-conductance mechanosensitive channel